MCHVSVGHLARLLEEAGIATVILASIVFRPRLEAMSPPRVLFTQNVMGRTVGPPGDAERQREAVLAALQLLEHAREGGTIEVLPP